MCPARDPTRPRPGRIGLLASLTLAALHTPALAMLLAGTLALVVAVYLAVIVAAVWLDQPARRRDARAVLQQLLDALRPARDP